MISNIKKTGEICKKAGENFHGPGQTDSESGAAGKTGDLPLGIWFFDSYIDTEMETSAMDQT